MKVTLNTWNVLKQVLLVVAILYFYALALVIQLGLPTYGLDAPSVFAGVATVFLLAIAFEAGVTWWHERRRIVWALLGLGCYAVLGFLVAPALYGQDVIWIPLLAPLVLIFVGGFLYAYTHILRRAFFSSMKLSTDAIVSALRTLPGWDFLSDGLEKTFRFSSYPQAVEFMTRVIVAAHTHHREPDLTLNRRALKVRIATEGEGVTQTDLDLAKTINAL